ncbi:DUF58 domain-containing protein [Paenibacillus sp.]|uniref:DUF58 domain-containing protein n=1 Tax=Paenibacillus sp. TaxID=58172 RepID=UPI0028B19AE0|nr:DUF58 domain-containing protein [Paenibacillus sp.]
MGRIDSNKFLSWEQVYDQRMGVPLSSSSLIDQQKKDAGSVISFSYPRSRSALIEWLRMLTVAGIIGALYAWRGGPSLLFLLIVIGIIMLGGLVLQLSGPRTIKLVRAITPARPMAGNTLHVKVQLSFSSRLPLPWMTIADYWGDSHHQKLLFPGFRRSFSYTYTIENISRGHHHLLGCRVTWGDFPGWFTGRSEPDGGQSFKVLPAPLYFGGTVPDSGFMTGDTMYSRRGRSSSDEALESRDYEPGDPLSRIHWKNSARTGALQSKVPEREKARMTCIVLANDPHSYEVPTDALMPRGSRDDLPPTFEKAVSTAMGLMLFAERSGAYVQLFSGGWPEGMARHEGLGKIPGRVLDILTEISPDGTRNLSQLLEDASRGWIPGMTVAIITGRLEAESAKVIAKFLVQGVKVELYYAWDQPAPMHEEAKVLETRQPVKGTIGDSLARLGARMSCLDDAFPAFRFREVEYHESSGKPTLR